MVDQISAEFGASCKEAVDWQPDSYRSRHSSLVCALRIALTLSPLHQTHLCPATPEPPPGSRIALPAADVMSTALLAKPLQSDQVLKEQDRTATRRLSVARVKSGGQADMIPDHVMAGIKQYA